MFSAVAVEKLMCEILGDTIACFDDVTSATTTSSIVEQCPPIWVSGKCWPKTNLNETAHVTCTYTNSGAADDEAASMECSAQLKDWNVTSSNDYCLHRLASLISGDDKFGDYIDPTATPLSIYSDQYDVTNSDYNFEEEFEAKYSADNETKLYSTLQSLVTVGHALSLTALVFALCLLLFLRRLHCTRIFVHMNLMAALMFRGVLWILHMTAFTEPDSAELSAENTSMELVNLVFGQYRSADVAELRGHQRRYCAAGDSENYVWCRLYYVMLNYAVTASYYWLLVEGLYLTLLLRAAVFSNFKYMRAFLALGWGCPWLSVVGWVFLEIYDQGDKKGCWFEDKKNSHWLIIKVPILVSLIINFGIFVMVVKVVGSKLKVTRRRQLADVRKDDYKWRLTKSTLALIPLLGIQYVVTAFLDERGFRNPTAAFVKQAFEVSFVSIQGLLVAFIYCFFNGEVQEECVKTWKRWKNSRDFERESECRTQRKGSMTSAGRKTSATMATNGASEVTEVKYNVTSLRSINEEFETAENKPHSAPLLRHSKNNNKSEWQSFENNFSNDVTREEQCDFKTTIV